VRPRSQEAPCRHTSLCSLLPSLLPFTSALFTLPFTSVLSPFASLFVVLVCGPLPGHPIMTLITPPGHPGGLQGLRRRGAVQGLPRTHVRDCPPALLPSCSAVLLSICPFLFCPFVLPPSLSFLSCHSPPLQHDLTPSSPSLGAAEWQSINRAHNPNITLTTLTSPLLVLRSGSRSTVRRRPCPTCRWRRTQPWRTRSPNTPEDARRCLSCLSLASLLPLLPLLPLSCLSCLSLASLASLAFLASLASLDYVDLSRSYLSPHLISL
jgi:hypothetical protein